jgi:hypothetical protein
MTTNQASELDQLDPITQSQIYYSAESWNRNVEKRLSPKGLYQPILIFSM